MSLNTGLYLHEMVMVYFHLAETKVCLGQISSIYTYKRARLFCAWTAFLSSAESFIISADNPSDLLCSFIS